MYDSDLDQKKMLKIGQVYKVKVSRPRNYEFHKKFFALIKLVYDNQEVFNNQDHLRKELIKQAGFYDIYHGLNGVPIMVAKSISFGSMSESEFSELYNRVIDVVVKYFAFDRQELMDEIEQHF